MRCCVVALLLYVAPSARCVTEHDRASRASIDSRREESAFFFYEPTAEDQPNLAIKSKFPDFSNFVWSFYTLNIVPEDGSLQYSLASEFDLSLTGENAWILAELN